MLKTESFTATDGTIFNTTQFPAMHSLELMAQLMKTIGPAIAALQGVNADTDLSTLGPALSGALAGLKPNEASQLVLAILGSTTAQVTSPNGQQKVMQINSREVVDLVFSNKLKTMFAVLGHALKVNYSDFFGEPGQGDLQQ